MKFNRDLGKIIFIKFKYGNDYFFSRLVKGLESIEFLKCFCIMRCFFEEFLNFISNFLICIYFFVYLFLEK